MSNAALDKSAPGATDNATAIDPANYRSIGDLQVANVLAEFVESEVLPGLKIDAAAFWQDFSELLAQFAPRNAALLQHRAMLQAKVDEWHAWNDSTDADKHLRFLRDIGYLVEEVADFSIATSNVDPEIASIAGPQLVVPVKNARYALNACNARWGSLYDALYGTDVIEPPTTQKGYDKQRGDKVIRYGRDWLDRIAPLRDCSHAQLKQYAVKAGRLVASTADDCHYGLADPGQFVGFRGEEHAPEAILLRNNGLHIEILIDRNGAIGADDHAGVQDILVESALTTIQDCEDSVAAVDAEDKTEVYRNWLGLMRGDLQASFSKGGKIHTREMVADREYTAADGSAMTLPGRSLLLVRNVGLLMNINAVLDATGAPVPEGILDAWLTAAIGKYDIEALGSRRNSRSGSMYIVKPKMHGPDEVTFTCELFTDVERRLQLPARSLKLGIMDEERRTSMNLKACIHAARDRVIFINTGFLDRTGDEIHTAMEAGPMLPKAQMRNTDWIEAYERANVAIGLQCGLSGHAQIGKGMWAMPDEMQQMMQSKIAHPESGANCAWVPSPTAATLHALHYHDVDVFALQRDMLEQQSYDTQETLLSLAQVPIIDQSATLDPAEVSRELENNAQGILGYVVHWINSGTGCSKIPDINDVGLMEDRATLRISSQHIANWLHHGICSHEQVLDTLKRIAALVDQQNEGDADYQPMAPGFGESLAFQAACALVFKGREQPSGYTEPLLHEMRLRFKAKQ